jgi:hypothetical protein
MPCTTEQEALLACLVRREAKLAKIYSGGLVVFYDDANPCRFELTAHSMRELMEKCPLLIKGNVLPTGDGMKSRLEPVRQAYLTVTQDQPFNQNFSLVGMEGAVRAVFSELSKFFKWQADNRPQAERRTAETLAALSGPGQALPVDISESEVTRWMEADEYFKMVAHNRADVVDQGTFVRHMTFIESVLLRRLQPRAVPGLDALDALIKEGENGH